MMSENDPDPHSSDSETFLKSKPLEAIEDARSYSAAEEWSDSPSSRSTALRDYAFSYTDPAGMFRDTEPRWRTGRKKDVRDGELPTALVDHRLAIPSLQVPLRSSQSRDSIISPSKRGGGLIRSSSSDAPRVIMPHSYPTDSKRTKIRMSAGVDDLDCDQDHKGDAPPGELDKSEPQPRIKENISLGHRGQREREHRPFEGRLEVLDHVSDTREQPQSFFQPITSHKPYAMPVKGILRRPTERFPEDPHPIREGVSPLLPDWATKSAKAKEIPKDAKWTKIDRKLVNPQSLEEKGERFEERLDCVIVLRVLTRDEIKEFAERTEDIRGKTSSSPLCYPPGPCPAMLSMQEIS